MDILLGNDCFEEILRTQNSFRPMDSPFVPQGKKGTDTRKSNARRKRSPVDVEECATRPKTRAEAETCFAPTALKVFVLAYPALTRWADLWRAYGATKDERRQQQVAHGYPQTARIFE
jgi:hypothetical protein